MIRIERILSSGPVGTKRLISGILVSWLSASGWSYSQVVVSVVPETCSVNVGGRASFAFFASKVSHLLGAHLVVTFDSSVVCGDSLQRGPLLRQGGESAFFSSNSVCSVSTRGSITIDQAGLSTGGVSGSGALLNITFRGLAKGSSSIGLESIDLRDSANHMLPVIVVPGTVTVFGP